MPRARTTEVSLAGWYVISLRPLNQHGGVRRAATRLGARTFALSTLRLQALDAKPALRAALACPIVLVSSPAAVRAGDAQLPFRARRGQRWFALGAGSAAALARRGVRDVRIPVLGSDSEALLAHPELQQVRGQPIGLLTAPGGRGLIESTLKARGARVQVANVYRREPRALPSARLHAFAQLPATTAVLMTSSEAFDSFWTALTPALRKQVVQWPCVVASDRLATRARSLGFRTVLRAVDARPASLLAALASHVGLRRFR